MLGGAGVVYIMKYDSERAVARIGKLQRQIADERQQISALKVEWSQLNQPKRLQELVEKYHNYLELDRLDPNQVATIEEIPLRAALADPGGADAGKGPSRLLAIAARVGLDSKLQYEHLSFSRLNSSSRASSTSFRSTSSASELCRALPEKDDCD
eukprot:gene20014-20541_t